MQHSMNRETRCGSCELGQTPQLSRFRPALHLTMHIAPFASISSSAMRRLDLVNIFANRIVFSVGSAEGDRNVHPNPPPGIGLPFWKDDRDFIPFLARVVTLHHFSKPLQCLFREMKEKAPDAAWAAEITDLVR
jgi:hypothetical protein